MGKQIVTLSPDERLLVDLHRVANTSDDESVRQTCRSLVLWFQRGRDWSFLQRRLIEQLCEGHHRTKAFQTLRKAGVGRRPRRPMADREFFLYAIQIGTWLKVGMTTNIGQRVNSFRTTAKDSQIDILHTIPLGKCGLAIAKSREKRLHKFIRGHWIEREIFDLKALPMIKQFNPKIRSCVGSNR